MSEIIKTKLVGVTQINDDERTRQSIIKKYVNTDEVLLLERESANSIDPNAIAAYVAPDDDHWGDGEYQIGYLKSELASRLAPIIDAGGRVTCVVLEKTGGSNGEGFGVNVALGVYSPEEVIEYEKTKTSSFPMFTQSTSQSSTPSYSPAPPQTFIQKPKKIVNYKIGTWRAIIGVFMFIVGLTSLTAIKDDPSILVATAIFIIPAGILLLPWERWIYDQIKKMFARKH